MKNKNKPAAPINYYLKDYFSDIAPYSSEHMRDISRFNRLLDNLQGCQKSGEDQKAFAEIGALIRDLNAFLVANNIGLTDEEQAEITTISGSNLSPAVSKTRIEDVIHHIKIRAQADMLARRESQARESEIRELSYSPLKIIDWLRVTKWALDYGTITLFTHRLKDSSLVLIQKRCSELLGAVIKGIGPLLDREYFLLSILEYNSIELFLRMRGVLRQIIEIPPSESYSSNEISARIDAFTEIYMTMLQNSQLIEQGFKKAFKKDKAPHGFWGAYYEFMGAPVYNSKQVKLSEYDRITKTILGVLLSYYTCQAGVVVRTANQIIYLNGIDCAIDGSGKKLTPAAMKLLSQSKQETAAPDERESNRFAELDRIVNRYLPQGAALSDLLARHDSKLNAQQLKQENESRPMARIKKILEGYIRFFLEPLSTQSFVPVYDNRDYPDFFERNAHLINVARSFNLMDFEIIGTKERDFVSLQLPENSTAKQLIFSLTRLDIPKASYDSRMALAQTILKKVSGASYHLALAMNDIIRKYHENKMLIQSDITANYDFFTGAVIMEKEHSRLRTFMKKEGITLAEFLEAACSVAFCLSDELNHEGIESIRKELDSLRPAEQGGGTAASGGPALSFPVEMSDEESAQYRDPLTGLVNYRYLLERVSRKLYDSSMKFRFDWPRYAFIVEIDGLARLNNLWGHDFGDRVIREVSRAVAGRLHQEGRDENDFVMRYDSGMLLGYLNRLSLSSAVDRLVAVRKDVNGLQLRPGQGGEILSVALNIGIYQERPDSDCINNIRIARKVLSAANKNEANRVGFMRDQNRIVTDKDFSIGGDLDEAIVSAV